MYVVESKGGAIVCMLVSLFFLGTWPAVMTMLERRGRLPQHTYLDYTLTNLLAAVIIAFTFGEIGHTEPNFLSQLSQVNLNFMFMGSLIYFCFNVCYLVFMYSIYLKMKTPLYIHVGYVQTNENIYMICLYGL